MLVLPHGHVLSLCSQNALNYIEVPWMKQLNPSSHKRKIILLVAFFAIIKKMFSFWEILAVGTMILHQILLTHLYLYHLDIKSTLRLNFCQILTAHLHSKGNVTEMVDVIIILFYFIYFFFYVERILVMIHCGGCVCVCLIWYFRWDFLITGNHIWQSIVNHNFDLHSILSLRMCQWHTNAP